MRQGRRLNKPADLRDPYGMPTLFRLFSWPQRLLLLGPALGTGMHRHHATQICIGLERPLSMRSGVNEAWTQAQGFFVPADWPHQLDTSHGSAAFLYLEAESDECLRYSARRPRELSALEVDEWLPLLRDTAARGDPRDAESIVVKIFGEERISEGLLDSRIAAAQRWIDGQLGGAVYARDVARAVNLSESRLAHLFSEQVGVPMRRYVLWCRLRKALADAMRGASLTSAAHAAGFADSAHLSRAFKENFGVAPSFLFEHRDRITFAVFE